MKPTSVSSVCAVCGKLLQVGLAPPKRSKLSTIKPLCICDNQVSGVLNPPRIKIINEVVPMPVAFEREGVVNSSDRLSPPLPRRGKFLRRALKRKLNLGIMPKSAKMCLVEASLPPAATVPTLAEMMGEWEVPLPWETSPPAEAQNLQSLDGHVETAVEVSNSQSLVSWDSAKMNERFFGYLVKKQPVPAEINRFIPNSQSAVVSASRSLKSAAASPSKQREVLSDSQDSQAGVVVSPIVIQNLQLPIETSVRSESPLSLKSPIASSTQKIKALSGKLLGLSSDKYGFNFNILRGSGSVDALQVWSSDSHNVSAAAVEVEEVVDIATVDATLRESLPEVVGGDECVSESGVELRPFDLSYVTGEGPALTQDACVDDCPRISQVYHEMAELCPTLSEILGCVGEQVPAEHFAKPECVGDSPPFAQMTPGGAQLQDGVASCAGEKLVGGSAAFTHASVQVAPPHLENVVDDVVAGPSSAMADRFPHVSGRTDDRIVLQARLLQSTQARSSVQSEQDYLEREISLLLAQIMMRRKSEVNVRADGVGLDEAWALMERKVQRARLLTQWLSQNDRLQGQLMRDLERLE